MIYQVQTQFIPGNDQIWVARLNINDPIYEYSNFADAQTQAILLENNDLAGRQYRVVQLAAE